jgi:hypothetical protein
MGTDRTPDACAKVLFVFGTEREVPARAGGALGGLTRALVFWRPFEPGASKVWASHVQSSRPTLFRAPSFGAAP